MAENTGDFLTTAFEPFKSPVASSGTGTGTSAASTGGAGAWPSTAELRSRATRRRHRRMAGGTSLGLAVVLAVGLTLSADNGHGDQRANGGGQRANGKVQSLAGPDGSVHLVANVNPLTGNASYSKSEALAEQGFALELTREVAAMQAGDNVLVSPLSADLDLAMLELGSAGATTTQIAAALQSSGLTPTQQATAWSNLVATMMGASSGGEIHIANSLWVQRGLPIQPSYLRAVGETFGNDTYQVDFTSNTAEQAINAWVSAETAGCIKELFTPGELIADTELVLANALHFHAAWAKTLFAAATVQQVPFFTAGGAKVSSQMVVDSQDSFLAGVTPAYKAVEIPYTNGRFAALLIEPAPGTMESFLGGLTQTRLSTLTTSLRSESVYLKMPELALSARALLNEPLSAMGLGPAFYEANFSPMLGPRGAANQAIGVVQQAATLNVNRWGTDAAAGTGASVVPVDTHGTQARITFDHPYLFFIRDTVTGTILFSSVVNDPTKG
jgi:serpin B